jgi:DNA-binding FrmR family transcriptional regulator
MIKVNGKMIGGDAPCQEIMIQIRVAQEALDKPGESRWKFT